VNLANLAEIENHVGFLSALISLVGVLFAITIWLQQRFRWVERLAAFLFKATREEESFSKAWLEGLSELESLHSADASLYSFRLDGMPRIHKSGAQLAWMNTPAVLEKNKHHPINKTHAFVVGDEFRLPGTNVISYVQSDFAMVEAARAAGIKPPVISANAIVFCPSTKEILLHFRVPTTRTYPRAIHFLGGNYEPALNTEYFDDGDTESPLRRAALREIAEESGLRLVNPPKAIVMIGEELTTGFVQFTYAGLAVPTSLRNKVKASPEGGICWVSFDELVTFSETGLLKGKDFKIVPSCALTLMMWLKLGAPDEYRMTPLHKLAIETYRALLPRIGQRFARP